MVVSTAGWVVSTAAALLVPRFVADPFTVVIEDSTATIQGIDLSFGSAIPTGRISPTVDVCALTIVTQGPLGEGP